ncbi:MAG: hypothetical protein ACREV3_03055 [Gammaproteobacteria bacterium]
MDPISKAFVAEMEAFETREGSGGAVPEGEHGNPVAVAFSPGGLARQQRDGEPTVGGGEPIALGKERGRRNPLRSVFRQHERERHLPFDCKCGRFGGVGHGELE